MQGGWADDLKQGLGKKVYANGDVYEGLWKGGKCEGPGRYRWRNNNEYDGEWKAGRMHGRGTLKWHTGGLRTLQQALSDTSLMPDLTCRSSSSQVATMHLHMTACSAPNHSWGWPLLPAV